jgi:hypothetical protein
VLRQVSPTSIANRSPQDEATALRSVGISTRMLRAETPDLFERPYRQIEVT